jgi:succinylglutamate desuccinylase
VALADGQDTDQNKQIRDWVRETKKEILAVMRSEGKTFAQVMEEQFNQLIELGQYKRDLEQELRQIRKSGEFSADEYDKFIQAANTMLESKGCTPLKVPKATYYQLELYKQRKALKDQNRNNQTTDGGY